MPRPHDSQRRLRQQRRVRMAIVLAIIVFAIATVLPLAYYYKTVVPTQADYQQKDNDEIVLAKAETDQESKTSQTRAQAAADNQAAAQRQTASGQCIQGYVWRQARPQDHVCVTPQTRAQTAKDNAAAGAS